MSAPSQPADSRMNTDSANTSSPGGVLSSAIGATKPKVFDENGAVGGAFTGMSCTTTAPQLSTRKMTDKGQKTAPSEEQRRRLVARWTRRVLSGSSSRRRVFLVERCSRLWGDRRRPSELGVLCLCTGVVEHEFPCGSCLSAFYLSAYICVRPLCKTSCRLRGTVHLMQ